MLAIAVSLLLASPSPSPAVRTAGLSPLSSQLRATGEKLRQVSVNLTGLAVGLQSPESKYANQLTDIADRVVEVLTEAEILLEICQAMQNKVDRIYACTLMQSRLTSHLRMLEFEIKRTNLNLGATSKPAVAQEGARLRDLFGEVTEVLTAAQSVAAARSR